MDRANRQIRTALLLVGDLVLLYGALFITLKIRYGTVLELDLWWEHFRPFSVVFIAWVAIFSVGGLYDITAGGGRMQMAARLISALATAGVIASTYFYLGYRRLFFLRPQAVLLIMLGVSFFVLLGWRIIFLAGLRSPRLRRRVLLVGNHQIVPELINEVLQKPQLGYFVAAWLQPNEATRNLEISKSQNLNVPTYHDLKELRIICQRHQIDLIVSGISPHHHKELLRELLACVRLRIDFSELSNFYERITGRVPVDAIEQVWLLENLQEGTKRLYELMKRGMDMVLSLLILAIVWPVLVILYFLVKHSSPGPFLFTQVRVGEAGRHFRAMKIRTMVADAEKSGPQWASRRDQRVTPVGRILRSMRLDEIPQLINVLRGEMSLIGPRPERPEFIEQLKTKIPFYEERLLVKPGLTGWAQVNFPYGASVEDALEKLQYDLFYIKHRSLGLDLAITLRTIGTILSRSG